MKLLKAFVFFVIVVVFNSCSNSTEPTSVEIKPFEVGNYWEYSVTLRKLSDNTIRGTGTSTFEVIGVKEIDGEKWFQISAYDGYEIYFQKNKPDGLWTRYDDSTSRLEVPFPSKPGHRIPIGKVENGVFKEKYFITESTNVSVTVPKGAFNCYEYKTEIIRDDSVLCACDQFTYYSPNVGMIKHIEKMKESELVLELVKFGKR